MNSERHPIVASCAIFLLAVRFNLQQLADKAQGHRYAVAMGSLQLTPSAVF